MKANTYLLLTLFVTSSLGAAERDASSNILREILQHSPAIEAARQDWKSAAENPEVVASMPDPMLGYGYETANISSRPEPMEQRFGVSQKIPFPGKLGTAKREAQEQAQIAYWRYRAAIRDTLAQAKTLLAELVRVDGSIDVLREQETLLRQTGDSAEALFKANQTGLPDVIRSTVAAEDLLTRITALDAQRVAVAAMLKALRGEVSGPLKLPPTRHPALPALPSLAASVKLSMIANQELQAAENAVARDAYAIRLARLEYYPDLTLGVDYDRTAPGMREMFPDREKDSLMVSAMVNVPIWWDKLGAQKRAAEARRHASIARRTQLALDTTALVEGAHAVAKSAWEQRQRFADKIVPEARRAYESVTSNYTAGAASLTDLLDIQRAYNDAALGLVERTAAYLKAIADLERAVGQPIGKDTNDYKN